MEQGAQDYFYNQLPAVLGLDDTGDFSAYQNIPEDWIIIITDVVGSTNAVRVGHYREVNLVGVAAISAIKNIAQAYEVPFQFGGDGASMVIPPCLLEDACEALKQLQAHAVRLYNLQLRVGVYPMRRIRGEGGNLQVLKCQLSPNNMLAFFTGNGFELAETLLKKGDNVLEVEENALPSPDLQGLSCRWKPLAAKHGIMICFMIKNIDDTALAQNAFLTTILTNLREILGKDISMQKPVRHENLEFNQPKNWIKDEMKALQTGWKFKNSFFVLIYFMKLLIIYIAMRLSVGLSIPMGGFKPKRYIDEIISNTDYIKFDGIFRAVLDVTPQDAEKLMDWLEKGWQKRQWIYGTHQAGHALMTCLVTDLINSQHVHFIDGDQGGFTLASHGFKDQYAIWKKEHSLREK